MPDLLDRLKQFLKSSWSSYLLWGAVALYYFRFIRRPDGMTLFPRAADCFLLSKPLSACAGSFTYPPVFAFFMIPFALMPMWLRNLIWYAISVSVLFGSFRIAEYLVLKTMRVRFEAEISWFRFLSFVLTVKFIFAVLENQSYDFLILFFVLVGLYGLVEEKDEVAALGIALAAALKATPLLFFPYLLVRRKWKAFSECTLMYLLLSFLPDLFFSAAGQNSYFGRWIQDDVAPSLFGGGNASSPRFWEGENQLNQSLRSFVYRLVERAGLSPHFSGILFAVDVLFLLSMLFILLKSSRRRTPYVLDGSALLVGMLMLSPMSSKSHFIVLVLPNMLILAYLMNALTPSLGRIVGWLFIISFVFNSLTSRGIVGSALSSVLLSIGCVTIGTLLIFIDLGLIAFEGAPIDATHEVTLETEA